MSASTWWSSLRHGGLLLAPSRLAMLFPDELAPLSASALQSLRRAQLRLNAGTDSAAHELLSTLLEDACGLGHTHGTWQRGAEVPPTWRKTLVTGEPITPRWLWTGPHGAALPVFVTDDTTLGVGKGRRNISRTIEWMRAMPTALAVVTNLRQWRIIYAGIDHEAWCESDSQLWLGDGAEGEPLLALRRLLNPSVLTPIKADEHAPLLAAIIASRRGQAELSAELGERVRRSVEKLIQAHGPPLADLRNHAGQPLDKQAIYRAGVRMIMRLVVSCFAEARDLLPRSNAVFHSSYSLQALRDGLDRQASEVERLGRQHGAWPRLLALFRLIHAGSHHPDLNLTRYGGELFAPGDSTSTDPLSRALAVFEAPEQADGSAISDATVAEILRLITFVPVAIRQGRVASRIQMPVDFADLSSEYLGIIYEGLLDYELKRVDGDDPVVFLAVGNQPALPLSRLEAFTGKDLKDLLTAFKKAAKAPAPEGDDEAGEEDPDPADDTPGDDLDTVAEPAEVADIEAAADDARHAASQRFLTWATAAVGGAGLVSGGKRRNNADPADAITAAAKSLASRIVLPGEWYLVRWGGTRKGHGTFYTRPALAGPLVHRTLAPLIAIAPEGNDLAPFPTWTLRDPIHLLSRTVCDPACGSGSMLVATLRFMANGLWRSLLQHRWVELTEDGLRITVPTGGPEWLREALLACRPQDPGAEDRLRAILKRLVVERCVYGVELDPLATELARLALWIETMDRDLPFGFLDHKIRCGNSLVGAWFDQISAYPIMAWERKAGDEKFDGVHHAADSWAQAIASGKTIAKTRLVEQIIGVQSFLRPPGRDPVELHQAAVTVLERIHAIPAHEAERRAQVWKSEIVQHPDMQRLRCLFDGWCAVWFWPADSIDAAPMPDTLVEPPPATAAIIAAVAQERRFFHWELEFPEVFHKLGSGFSAIVGNPPWETLQPNSKEFFSEYDPLYRTYGKQVALKRQKELFEKQPEIESNWLQFMSHFKAMGQWFQSAGNPFGAAVGGQAAYQLVRSKGNDNAVLHTKWALARKQASGFADPEHSYLHQGRGKAYTYKMFLEQAHALIAPHGQLGFLVPSNVYTDQGSADLRRLFLDRCQWRWLFSFENRNKIFDIHGSFKFAALIIEKGGQTQAVQTAFMRRSLDDWQMAERHLLACPREQIERFSPLNRVVLEVCHSRDLLVLDKMYANGVLLGDRSEFGWGVTYRQGDFNMTTDSKLFPPREKWEADGYRADEYGHWIKGDWHDYHGDRSILHRPDNLVLSLDGTKGIEIDSISGVALPLYEGRMIDQYDLSSKGWVSGKGRTSVWREIPHEAKVIEPQFLIDAVTCTAPQYDKKTGDPKPSLMGRGAKLAFMDIASATNERTMFCAGLYDRPCGNSSPILNFNSWILSSILNSFSYDYAVRQRCGGLHLNYFVIEETPLIQRNTSVSQLLSEIALRLTAIHPQTSHMWNHTGQKTSWRRQWAVTPHERLRLRCISEALVAHAYGLSVEDIAWILRDCDHPSSIIGTNDFSRALDPKGFWRVDKGKDPELRQSVLTQVAFQDLCRNGLDAFLKLHGGEGWMLPESLRLSDYRLGHDARAQEQQRVASRIGDRYLQWQLDQPIDESWEECRRHAALVARIVPPTELVPDFASPTPEIPASASSSRLPPDAQQAQVKIESQPISTVAGGQEPLFASLLAALRNRGSIASSEAQALLGMDANRVRPFLQRLETEGYATTTGQRRSLRYVIRPETTASSQQLRIF